MNYTPVPAESKGQINRAGKLLTEYPVTSIEYKEAQELANRWRAAHAYPINTFQATLRTKLKSINDKAIVAQRLKRMPTVIDKLKRYPNMKLTTMQDIGGIRAIVDRMTDVNALLEKYENNKSFPHEFISKDDYINSPRPSDGYRSIHLIYKYGNKRNPAYDGLRVEIQIRTQLQHIWATAVETMGTFLGQALKSRQGDQIWIDFFALTSSAFAYLEKCPPIPRFAHLNRTQTFKEVAKIEEQLKALDKMKGFSAALDVLPKNKAYTYHLLVLDSLNNKVQIGSYDRHSFADALNDYSNIENQAAQGRKIEPVLVSAGPMATLRKAYPNLFLDISEFEKTLKKIITLGQKQSKA